MVSGLFYFDLSNARDSSLTFVSGAYWAAEDGCQVEDVFVAGGFKAEEGGRRIFGVLVELFD